MKTHNPPDIIFLGQPNCGKSTLFNAIAGLKAETSNFPGTTVKHTHSRVNFEGRILNIIDLPGTYSLNPREDAENVALTHLFVEKPDLIINVIDASILGRSLELTLELIELEYPMIVALNMLDLAEKKGMDIDVRELERRLGVPVVPTVASHGKGIKDLLQAAIRTIDSGESSDHIDWSKDVEDGVEDLIGHIPPEFPIVSNPRFTAIKMIESGRLFFDRVLGEMNPELKVQLQRIRSELESRHDSPAYEIIAAERHHLAFKILEHSSRVVRGKTLSPLERADEILMHPVFGYLILLAVFFGFFLVIFMIGNPIEELLLGPFDRLRQALSVQFGRNIVFFALDGLIQGIGGGLAVVLPYFVPLLFMMSLLEDVGYLPRAGFLMDAFMHRIGLHGKSVSPFILGFGCNVPAIMSTRILESRRDRVLTSLLIPFIPCSARTTIILALVAFYLGPFWAFGFYVFNVLLVGLLGRILSFFFKEPSPGLILEIPSLKVPSVSIIAKKTYIHLKSFARFAWPILIIGSVVLGLLQFLKLDGVVNLVLSPFVHGLLGLPEELGVTLVFGFLRKELSMIMMLQALGVSYQGLMNVISRPQLITFTVFISFFIPCLSTVAIIWKEIGKKEAFLSVGLNITVASVISLLVRALFSL